MDKRILCKIAKWAAATAIVIVTTFVTESYIPMVLFSYALIFGILE